MRKYFLPKVTWIFLAPSVVDTLKQSYWVAREKKFIFFHHAQGPESLYFLGFSEFSE